MSHFTECLGPFIGSKQTFQPSFEEAIQLGCCCWLVCERVCVCVCLRVGWVSIGSCLPMWVSMWVSQM